MRKSTKNAGISAILTAILIIIVLSGINSAQAQNSPGVTAIANKKSYSAGETGVLTISFKTGPNVKIPKDPEIVVNLTTNEIEGQGLQDYTGGDGDYLSNSKVKYNFTVPNDAASGSTINVTGNVRFGYCTTSDGVCKLGNRDFSAKVKVK